jgi:anti-anti-sigma factor
MAITVRRERGQRRIVVVVSGAVDAGVVPALRRALVRALRTRAPILIDLTDATSLHKDALAVLVLAHRQAERAGTQLLLRTEPTQIRDVLAAFGIPPESPADGKPAGRPTNEPPDR